MTPKQAIATAKAKLEQEIWSSKRRYMDAVGSISSPDDDFYLTRWALVRHLRQRGMVFKDIGALFGVTAVQARQLYLKSEQFYPED